MIYEIEFSKIAEKQFDSIPKTEQKKIVKKIEKLASNPVPMGSEKLKGSDDIYRIRQGDYRILYTILEKKLIVLILKIGHRREVYR